ncbi:hypothetical protein FRC09_012498 [Ceratobasidium sp. 395]|nr:hypothetical protein FRC09_012498 [Ceratobasidium sp. 395]
MLNLTVLSVNFHPYDFDAIVQGLNLPFRLNKFSSQYPPDLEFFRSQPSITTLEFAANFCNGRTLWSRCRHDRSILPALRHVKAPGELIWALVPGRPVTKIGCLVKYGMYSHVFDALVGSSLDVVWLESTVLAPSWEGFVQELVASNLKTTLKRLGLKLELYKFPPCCRLEPLSGFLVLEQLDFNVNPRAELSEQEISDWLGNMSTINTWQSLVPSLQVVTAFGRIIN